MWIQLKALYSMRVFASIVLYYMFMCHWVHAGAESTRINLTSTSHAPFLFNAGFLNWIQNPESAIKARGIHSVIQMYLQLHYSAYNRTSLWPEWNLYPISLANLVSSVSVSSAKILFGALSIVFCNVIWSLFMAKLPRNPSTHWDCLELWIRAQSEAH